MTKITIQQSESDHRFGVTGAVDTHSGDDQTFILSADHFNELIAAIRDSGYRVLGPVLADGAIGYDEIQSAADLPRGWTDEQEKGHYRVKRRSDDAFFGYAVGHHSWKRFLHPPRHKIWDVSKTAEGFEVEAHPDDFRPTAFIGVRSCELHAIARQDEVFLQGAFPNPVYQQRRAQIFTVAVNCTVSAATCFCTSMNTGPAVTLDSDLEMTEVIDGEHHYFVICSGSGNGNDVLAKLPVRSASASETDRAAAAVEAAEAEMQGGPRQFDSSDLKDLLYRNYESPAWDDVARRCLSCANCTMACPTCFCSTVEDTTDLSGDHAERWEQWDSCFTADFSHVHGGPVRPATRSRYRQWLTHKLATWIDQFGSSGCVGCGRCVTWCPVGIDLTEEVSKIRALEIR